MNQSFAFNLQNIFVFLAPVLPSFPPQILHSRLFQDLFGTFQHYIFQVMLLAYHFS